MENTFSKIKNDFRALRLELDGDWLRIWLSRPEVRNALSSDLVDELIRVFEWSANQPSLRGLILRGDGGIFCAGGDLKTFGQLASGQDVDGALRLAQDMSRQTRRLYRTIKSSPLVTVGLIEKAAIAGGFGLVAVCDYAFAVEDAAFSLSETRIGLTAAQLTPFLIDRLGFKNAQQLMISAITIQSPRALDLGLIDGVAGDAEELESLASNLMEAINACAPGAIAETKAVLNAARSLGADALDRLAAEVFTRSLTSPEAKEGISAFFEKRSPIWGDN